MVNGFDKFKQYFAPHSDSFIVIGGTAMQLHGREGGPVPRVTQDIDILVIVEQMSEPFTSAFHAFLREGRYDCYIAKEPDGSNKPRFYRFINPKAFFRLAGGRGVLADDGKRAFQSGANAASTDDMLTTAGVNSSKDFELVKGLGFEPHGFIG
jgi:hypothetical protein